MQHVMSVVWSLDNKFILSGSDEFNLRLWKAYASEKLGPVRILILIDLNHIFLVASP
jgi:WD repeat and SOF domain-containing protein 1